MMGNDFQSIRRYFSFISGAEYWVGRAHRSSRRSPASALNFLRILTAVSILLSLLSPLTAQANPFPPNWQNGAATGAVHFVPAAWPSEPPDPTQCGPNCGQWVPYTSRASSIDDPRVQDPSNGGTSPQNYVNIASSCIDTTSVGTARPCAWMSRIRSMPLLDRS